MTLGRDFFFSKCFVEIFSTFEIFFRHFFGPSVARVRKNVEKNIENVEKFEIKHEEKKKS